MSKIKSQYQKLKNEDADILYLFKAGNFYIAIDDDAKVLNEKLSLKITDFGNNSIKCGFPLQRIDTYKNYLNNFNIKYKIIENLTKSNDISKNTEIKRIIKEINDLDINKINSIEALNFLNNIQNKIKKL